MRPTHVLHISTEKDRDLPAVAMLRTQGAIDAGTDADVGTAAAAAAAAAATTGADVDAGRRDSRKRPKTASNVGAAAGPTPAASAAAEVDEAPCTIFTLEPGRSRPSKVAATDLRTLRFVAYFLRHSAALAGDHRARWGDGAAGCMGGIGGIGGIGGVGGIGGGGLYIRTGAVVDQRGSLALAVLRLPPLAARLTEVGHFLHYLMPYLTLCLTPYLMPSN